MEPKTGTVFLEGHQWRACDLGAHIMGIAGDEVAMVDEGDTTCMGPLCVEEVVMVRQAEVARVLAPEAVVVHHQEEVTDLDR